MKSCEIVSSRIFFENDKINIILLNKYVKKCYYKKMSEILLNLHNKNFKKLKNLDYTEQILDNDRYDIFVVIKNDSYSCFEDIIGYAIYYDVEYAIDLFEIAIDSKYNNNKIGSFLLSESLKYLYNQLNSEKNDDTNGDHQKRVMLEVKENSEKLVHFYKKHGFYEISIRKNYYGNGINGIVMEKILKW